MPEITNSGEKAIAIKADVSKTEDVKHLFDAAINHFDKVDILINNAGIAIYKLIKDTTNEDFDRIFSINVKGIFNTMREAATRLEANGRIINFSGSVKVFAKEIGSRKITVNSVSPGPINTELFTRKNR